MTLWPQFGQTQSSVPSSSIKCNIYKPLKRINPECNGGAVLPISSTGPSGFVTVDLIDWCDADGFQSRCFGTRPLLKLSPSSAAQRRTVAWGWTGTTLLTKRMLISHLVEATTTSFIAGVEKVSLPGCTDYYEVNSYVLCAAAVLTLLAVTGLFVSMLFLWNRC